MLPEGQVTFLFTDIEGSTRLFRRLGDDYVALLDEHDRALQAAIEAHNGVVVKTEGDAFFAAFADARDGVLAAVAGQDGLRSVLAPDGSQVRVRMGLHTGLAYPRNNDYVALAVHQAARIVAAGHGGQIVMSDTTATTLAPPPPDIELDDLGAYRLKDFDDATRLFSVRSPGMTVEFPAPRALPDSRGNVPASTSPLIGREAELSSTRELLLSNRVVTIVGPGGAGKTRLATELAHDGLARGDWELGWFVDLTSATDGENLVPHLSAALGIDIDATTSDVCERLATQPALVIVDNCEHVVDQVRDLVQQLSTQTEATFLLTSQMPVGVRDEYVVRLGQLHDAAAVELLGERVSAIRHTPLAPEEREVATRICRALDGLPLALELAAARSGTFSLADIAGRLDERFRVLRSSAQPSRHQTLQAAIGWSYELCAAEEQLLLRRLGAFTGPFTLRLAEWTAGVAPLDELDVFDGLASLVDRSLVQVDDLAGRTLYRLSESVRAFALHELRASGELAVAASRVLARVLHGDDTSTLVFVAPLLDIDDDLPTIEATVLAEYAEPDLATRAAVRLSIHHRARGQNRHGLQLVLRVLAGLPNDAPGRGELLAAAAAHAVEIEDIPTALELLDRAQAAVDPSDNDLRAWIDGRRGLAAVHRDDLDAAKAFTERAAARGVSPHVRGVALGNLGLVNMEQGDYKASMAQLSEAADLYERLGALLQQANCVGNIAELWARTGNDDEALRHELVALRLRAELGAVDGIASSFIGVGHIARRRGAAGDAVELLSAGEMLFEECGTALYPSDQARLEAAIVELREQLGPVEFHARWNAGRGRKIEALIRLAQSVK